MTSNATKVVAGCTVYDLREFLSGRTGPEIHQAAAWPQDRLVATARKNGRARFEARLKSFDGLRRIILGQRDQNGKGDFKDVGPTLVFAPEQLESIQQLVDELRQACREEGLLP